jgi:hypothetical protein
MNTEIDNSNNDKIIISCGDKDRFVDKAQIKKYFKKLSLERMLIVYLNQLIVLRIFRRGLLKMYDKDNLYTICQIRSTIKYGPEIIFNHV